MRKGIELNSVAICDLCGTMVIRVLYLIEPAICHVCVAGVMVPWSGDQINAKLKALDEVMKERDEARALIAQFVMDLSSGYDVLASYGADKMREYLERQ